MHEQTRSKTSDGFSFRNPRLTGISLGSKSNPTESGDEIRGALGLNLLYEPPSHFVDLIFVHGLRGGSRKTWSKSADPETFWPKEWLPKEPGFETVRIYSFGYNSDWGEGKSSAIGIHDFGQALLGEIHNNNASHAKGRDNALVLVGHSMGGIIIKKLLLLARQDPLYQQIASRIHSLYFLATPHRGADIAHLLSNMLKISFSHNSKSYVDNLMPQSEAIQVINDGFRHAYQGIQLWSFFETVKTSLGLIVEKDSAVLDLPGERVQLLNADHRHVCKFESPSDSNYCTLRNALASTIISIEEEWSREKKQGRIDEMRSLVSYFGLGDSPEIDLANVLDFQIDGSCQWLTNDPAFQSWQTCADQSPRYFWLSGDPASGKSTLAGHVVKYLTDGKFNCSYFFFKHSGAGKTTLAELLRSLAWQMAASDAAVRQDLISMEQEHVVINKMDERSIWRTIFVSRIFRHRAPRKHFWVIDGLDECPNHAALFPFLAKLDPSFPLIIFLTSRPSLAIERYISQEKITMVHVTVTTEKTLDDISLLIKSHAQYLPVETDKARDELVKKILDRSSGNFLWTRLVIKELENAISEQRVLEILESVPKEMDEMYDSILRKVTTSPTNIALVTALLRWVVYVSRPLTVEELKEALRLDIGEIIPQLEKTASTICGNLVYVDSALRVRPAHQTLRDFLYRENNESKFAIHRPQAHARIAEVCLAYLQSDEMTTPRHRRGRLAAKRKKRSSFASYVTHFFSDHLVRSSSSMVPQLISLDAFLQKNSLTWFEIIATNHDLTPIIATAKNIKTYLERLAKYQAPIGSEIQRVAHWAKDLIHLVAQFGRPIVTMPTAIHHLIPPLCPADSVVRKTFGSYPRGLRLSGLAQTEWDDIISCIVFPEASTLSVAWRDNKYAVGLSNGSLNLYDETSFQMQHKLIHGEPVRALEFGTINTYLASAGRRKLRLWNTISGAEIWTMDVTDQSLALAFNENDTVLMSATRANALCFRSAETGEELDTVQFSDINEEDQSEYHYQRPPIHAEFCPTLNLLGVAYRNRPINFWDLEDHSFIGQYHKAGAVYPEPLIHDFIFNPNPDLSLAAVVYEDGEVATFDPFNFRTEAVVDAGASILAASPDGTILATGSGDGVIKIFDFETLGLFYQINSYRQDIKALCFNSSNSRFCDIRSNQCNLWEPSALIRQVGTADDSSLNFSENVMDGPQYAAPHIFDEDMTITAVEAFSQQEFVLAGRENGTVAIYSATSGQLIQEIFVLYPGVAIVSLGLSRSDDMLTTRDCAGCCVVYRLTQSTPGQFETKNIFQKISPGAKQVLLSPDATRLLISMPEAVELWSLDGTLLNRNLFPQPAESCRWMNHPHNDSEILQIIKKVINIVDWNKLSTLTALGGIELSIPSDFSEIANAWTPFHGQNICLYFTSSRTGATRAALSLWPTNGMKRDAILVKPSLSYDEIVEEIKCTVGLYRSSLVFLDKQGWVCSVATDDVSREKHYTKHFFIPSQWHSTIENISVTVTSKGTVVLGVRHEIAVFQNGLEFEEKIGLKGALVSAKASMRAVLKRGVSSPG